MARLSVSELEWIQHTLQPISSLVIVPVFALANAGISFTASDLDVAVSSPITLGILLGLVLGKTIGIAGAAWLASRFRVAELPDVPTRQPVGVAALGGIGFTVSLFVTDLAFENEGLIGQAKIGILAASIAAAILGTSLLRVRDSTPS